MDWGCQCCNQRQFSPTRSCATPRDANDAGCGDPGSPDSDCNKNNPPASAGTGGKPINFGNGTTYIRETDLSVPGLGGLMLVRTWSSRWPESLTNARIGMFGFQWRCNFEERIFWGGDGSMKYGRGSGNAWTLGYDSSTGSYRAIAPGNATVGVFGDIDNWIVTLKDGEKRLFSRITGQLTTIIDRNGNTTRLSYDDSDRLRTVTDPVNRHIYFHYDRPSSPTLVTSVTTDFGVTTAYSYDDFGRLVSMTKQDGAVITFEYDSQSMITAVKDSQGKILESHTYDLMGRGLTSSQANGVGALTVTYPQ